MQLLTFARGGQPIKEVVKVGSLLRDAAGFALHGSMAKCNFDLGEDLLPVAADAGQLSQVIQNLVINADQAMPTGGELTVTARNDEFLPGEQKFVRISITDSGIGIPAEVLPRIFEPYFTTKQQGSGLGLAVCYSIIKKHGGDIRVESTPGQGTSIHIRLPATAPVASTASACPPGGSPRQRSGPGHG